jgi:predicted kinase
VHLRIDSIEQALRNAGVHVEGEGYAVAYAIAEDNLCAGRTVIADCVNPWQLTRDAWRAVAERAGVRVLEVELACSDPTEHRRRIESRVPDLAGHRVPSWQEVLDRSYHTWNRARLLLDTTRLSIDQSVSAIIVALTELPESP